MLILTTILQLACSPAKTQEDTALSPDWWETEVTETDTEDSAESEVDKEEEEYDEADIEDCADDFNPEEPCEGDWTTTMCMYDDLLWWCDNGVWVNKEEEK